MTKEDIKTIVELFISWNDEKMPIDTANIDSAVEYIHSCVRPPKNSIFACNQYVSKFNIDSDYWRTLMCAAFFAGYEFVVDKLAVDVDKMADEYAEHRYDSGSMFLRQGYKAGANGILDLIRNEKG